MFLTINNATLESNFNYEEYGIMLENPTVVKKQLVFHQNPSHIGTKLILSRQPKNFKDEFKSNNLSDENEKEGFKMNSDVVILCSKDQLLHTIKSNSLPTTIKLISISNPSNASTDCDTYVILLIVACKVNSEKEKIIIEKNNTLNNNTIKLMKLWKKPNLNSSNGKKHNNTYGKYYGFGLINKYNIQDGLSFGEFDLWQTQSNEHKNKLKKLVCNMFNNVSSVMNLKLPALLRTGNDFINSMIAFGTYNTTNKKFHEFSHPFDSMSKSYYSLWICENARTESFHQECDASYTLIGVPKLDGCISDNESIKYKFQFRWNNIEDEGTKGINIPLKQGICLYYNGFGLFHRQVPNNKDYEKSTFWNISMYHNNRLFNCINMSVKR